MSQDNKPRLYVFRDSGNSLDSLDRFREATAADIAAAGYIPLDIEAILIEDNPELDATDGAHPAWWRGHDNGAKGMLAVKVKLETAVSMWRDVAYTLHDQLISWRGSDEWDDACEAAHKKFRELCDSTLSDMLRERLQQISVPEQLIEAQEHLASSYGVEQSDLEARMALRKVLQYLQFGLRRTIQAEIETAARMARGHASGESGAASCGAAVDAALKLLAEAAAECSSRVMP